MNENFNMDLCSNDIEGPPILIRQILHQRLGRLMIQLARQGADVVVSVLHVELLSAEAQIPDVHHRARNPRVLQDPRKQRRSL